MAVLRTREASSHSGTVSARSLRRATGPASQADAPDSGRAFTEERAARLDAVAAEIRTDEAPAGDDADGEGIRSFLNGETRALNIEKPPPPARMSSERIFPFHLGSSRSRQLFGASPAVTRLAFAVMPKALMMLAMCVAVGGWPSIMRAAFGTPPCGSMKPLCV